MNHIKSKNIKGFTLIEMLVVIAIIGILSATVLTALGPSREKAQDANIVKNLQNIQALYESSYNASNGVYDSPDVSAATNEIVSKGGTFSGGLSSDARSYVIYSDLNGGGYYCIDNEGFNGKLDAAPSGEVCQ